MMFANFLRRLSTKETAAPKIGEHFHLAMATAGSSLDYSPKRPERQASEHVARPETLQAA